MELLKNAIFPLQFLGMTALGAILFEFSLQIVLLLILLLVSGIWISLNMLLLPVAILLFSTLILGCIWMISIVGYLLKDIREVINVILLGLVYVTPTMYPLEAAPRTIQKFIQINPITHMIIVFRDVWTPDGSGLAISSWIYFAGVSLLSVIIGHLMMRRVTGVVGDLI
jgi:ABC-type polysaccharide/polyol phosphate export permease